ncbi:MlaD family protein [Stutzerimonas balearica]|uniref:MlaD family protein n=1 Tax=Stutzerimonas balearica TaxID=74829 RepID=UPI0028A940BC|nr:MlaD family protein [Stutzerimonas balearica]
METRAHHVLIGLFTVLVVGGALLFALWLGKSSIDREYEYYEVDFNRAVSGLSTGSSVEYSGIKVGDVERLWLEPDDPRKVRARIRVYAGTPIRQDTRARLALANITGAMVIQLHGGSPESPLLVGKRSDPPLIIADPSPLSALLENGEDLMSNVNSLLMNANALFSEENAGRIGRTLEHLEQATSVLAEQRSDLSAALGQLSQITEQTNTALGEITRLTRSANGLLDEEGRALLVSAAQSMQALERSTERLDSLLSNNQGALNNGLQGFNDLGPAINELRATLGSLRRVTQHLEDNPSGFLLGREKLEEFEP